METLEKTVLNAPLWKFLHAVEVLILDWGVCDGESKMSVENRARMGYSRAQFAACSQRKPEIRLNVHCLWPAIPVPITNTLGLVQPCFVRVRQYAVSCVV